MDQDSSPIGKFTLHSLNKDSVKAITEDSQLMHPKGHIADILIVRSNSNLELNSDISRELNSSGWKIFGGEYSMEEIEWSRNNWDRSRLKNIIRKPRCHNLESIEER